MEMVDAVLLVLREILEAALIISLMMALSHKLKINYSWFYLALAGGVIGSWALAQYAYDIAGLFDDIGQELLNAMLYLIVILSLISLSLLILSPVLLSVQGKMAHGIPALIGNRHYYLFNILFITIVSFSVMREGAEIWIYLSGFKQQPNILYPALIGAVIGAGIVGALVYYLLVFIPVRFSLLLFLLIMTLLVGGLSMQIARQFMQAGLLESSSPLWDTSFLVSEQSWLGELLYALLGYDAKPTKVQIVFYLLAIMPVLFCTLWYFIRARIGSSK
jgi:high-affinity iron transporter